MKKKTVRIILGITTILLIAVSFFAYQIYQGVRGSETLTGSQSKIPDVIKEVPLITKGNADWPNWRGPHFDGKSDLKGIKTDWSKGLSKLWAVDYLCQGESTASWAAPVVQGNRLIVPGRDEQNDLVFCINSETGDLIWKGSYKAEAGTSHGPGSRATPAIDDDKVYTYGRNGDLVCWQLFDGKMLWHKNVKDIGGVEPDWGLSSTPLILNDKVIVQGGGKALVVAYNKVNGDVIWKSLEGASGYSAAVSIDVDSVKMLLIYHGTALSCLNPINGKEIWSEPWTTEYGVNATTPVFEKNIVFHTSGYEKGGRALKISKDKCQVLWKNEGFAAQHSDPIIINGYIYGYSGESSNMKGYFKCLELTSGKEMWTSKELGMGTSIYVDNYIICLDIKGNLHLIKPETKGLMTVTAMNKAMPDVIHPAWTSPIIANGKLYLRYMQRLICYDLMP
jgi:outer membrane protein assembly factor BamB